MNELADRFVAILENAKARIVANLDAKNINASGRTKESLRVEKYAGGVKLVIGGNNTAPLRTLEVGRADGAVPMNFQEIIKQWILDKGISVNPIPYKRKESKKWTPKYTPEERGLNYLAGAISEKIKKEGTNRYKEPIDDVYSNVVEDIKIQLTKEVGSYVANFVMTNKK